MLGLRFDSRHVKVVASAIGVISLFPWIVLGMQAMGTIMRWASFDKLSVTAAVIIGVAVIAIRQIWTIRMGMRGLVITDLVQGIVAYFGSGLLCLGLLIFFFHGFREIGELKPAMYQLPGYGSELGGYYFAAITATGIVGALCWPTSYQRIYTAKSVRHVKWGTFLTLPVAGIFYVLLTLVAMAATTVPSVAQDPQNAWAALMTEAGGTWLLAFGVLVVFAASMGWIDGCVQVCGTQIANDIVAQYKPLGDRARIHVAKVSMVVFTAAGAIVATLTFRYEHLIDLAIMAYQGIVQIAVPLFLGMFWKGGNKHGALWGLVVGFAIALVLTGLHTDSIMPGFGGVTTGVIALVANLAIYLGCAWLIPQSADEAERVRQLFDSADRIEAPSEPGRFAPEPAGA
jgi:Na+/proline symporter